MHIGIAETPEAGPGDCHIKGGYIEGAPTWTVKLANVSFYNNVKKGLPAGSGVFVVCDATNGGPKAVLHENRYLTDLRTGSAGAVCVKHLAPNAKSVAFIGTGVIAEAMARATATCTALRGLCLRQVPSEVLYLLQEDVKELDTPSTRARPLRMPCETLMLYSPKPGR